MPELTISRKNATPPPMVCMYCGKPASTTQEWREVNRRSEKGGGGGGDVVPVPLGDDPISAVIGVLLLPLVLWELLKTLVAAVGVFVGFLNRPTTSQSVAPGPPKEQPTTLVVVTACDRHRRFRNRFAWAGLGMAVFLAALWVWAIAVTRRVMGTDDTGLALFLLLTAIFSTCLLPLVLSTWYVFGGPVIVERVTEEAVVLDRVRQAYFDATGIKPTGPNA